jgi:hypothetical protein
MQQRLIINNKIKIKMNNKYIIVFFEKQLFLKQYYIRKKSKDYTFFLILLILDRYGLINLNKNQNVCV